MQYKLAYVSGGFVLGALLMAGYDHAPEFIPVLGGTTTATSSATLNFAPSDVLAVSNQAAGMEVVIDSVTVPPPGVWVAIVELMPDGTLGNVLGAARAGTPRSNLSVSLLRATLPGHQYAAVLYRDDGNGTFMLGEDSAYIDFDTGQRVVAPFSTSAN